MPVYKRQITAVLLVFASLGLAAWWLYAATAWYDSLMPKGPMLADYLAQQPSPSWRRVFVKDGKEYLALFGPNRPSAALPSGPPVYIFDKTGRLVEWTPDCGDADEFNRRWAELKSASARTATPEEVAAWGK